MDCSVMESTTSLPLQSSPQLELFNNITEIDSVIPFKQASKKLLLENWKSEKR